MAELFRLVGTIAIETDEAVQKINAVITEGEDLEKKLKGIGDNADSYIGSSSKFGTAAVWAGNMLSELSQRAAQIGKEFLLSGVKYQAAMEGYEVSFSTLLNGDTEKAKKLLEDIENFALNSPLNVSGVNAAALQLLNIGTAYEDIMPMLEMLGNLSLGDENKMSAIATAVSQVMGFGNLYGQEKTQFVNAGVPIYKLLEDYYKIVEGMNPAELDLDTMQRGKEILSEHVLGALQLATMSDEEIYKKYGYDGERAVSFYNAMEAMLPTFTGQSQKVEEQTQKTAGAVVEPWMDAATDKFLPATTDFAAAVEDLVTSNESYAEFATSVVDAGTNMVDALTAAINGEFAVSKENAENLSPIGKLVAGVYDWAGYKEDTSGDDRFHAFTDRAQELAEQYWDYERLGKDKRAAEFDNLLNPMYTEFQKVAAALGMDDTERGATDLIETLAEQFGMLDKNLEDLPDHWFDNQEEPLGSSRHQLDPGVDTSGSTGDGTSSIVGIVTAVMQGMLGTIKSEVAAGAQEGISAGIGGITVTGSISTGNVVLDTGVVAGTLAPKLNLALGTAQKYSARSRG